MKTTNHGSTAIAWQDAGHGEPALLCLPGWCCEQTVFADFVRLAAPHRRTLTLDWRGHGASAAADAEFGLDGLLEDALAVIEASGVTQVVPVASSHAGWVAIELRRRLGERVPALVLIDWLVMEPPSAFFGALNGLRDAQAWQDTRDLLLAMWLPEGVSPALAQQIRAQTGRHDASMWARAAHSIAAAYRAFGTPMRALSELPDPPPVLHLASRGAPVEALREQQVFASVHPWFTVHRLAARSHFPMLETPAATAAEVEGFLQRVQGWESVDLGCA